MGRKIQLTLDDDQFSQLEQLKDRYGYSWEELLTEGAQRIDSDREGISNRDRFVAKVKELREEFGDREHHSTFRVSSVVDERSGNEYLGIRVNLIDTDQFQLTSDLEDIDRSLYDDGYNTAWAYEKQRMEDDAFIPEGEYLYDGTTVALLIENGVPEVPKIKNAHTDPSIHQNIH